MIGIDTNVLVRFLTADDPDQSARAAAFLEDACTADAPGFINRIVACELVWVLGGAYGHVRADIARTIRMLLETAEIRMEDPAAVWGALSHYEAGDCDFADACLGLTNAQAGCEKTVTFDRGAATLDSFQAI